MGSPVTPELSDLALTSLLAQTPKDVASVDEVLSAISQFTGITIDRIIGKKRDRATAEARRMAMYMLREEAHLTSTRVGQALGGKDHSTVINACKRISAISLEDPETATAVSALRSRLSNVG